jgi:hypothetical protein
MTDPVEKAVGRIENQVLNIQDDVREIKDLIIAQNGRIRTLELENAKSQGGWKVAGIIGGVTGTVGGIAAKFFS